jgi:hypothetical protein
MASELHLYKKLKKYLADGTIDLDSNSLYLLLVTNSYVPSLSHAVLADVIGSPSPEVEAIGSPDNGYDTGGALIANKTLTEIASPSQLAFDADDVTWTALTATFRYGILYASGTLNGVVDPLIGYLLFDNTPADITVTGIDYTVQWAATGIIIIEDGD